MIYLTSDLHLYHDKEFIWKERDFKNIFEHDKTLIANINKTVGENDILYILGDICMGHINEDVTRMYLGNLLRSIKCKNIFFLEGNHDSPKKVYFYQICGLVDLGASTWLHDGKHKFLLTHYPTITSNGNYKGQLSHDVINLFGHTHQTEKFYSLNDKIYPLSFHIGVDSNALCPVSLEKAVEFINEEYLSCCKSRNTEI